MEFNIFTTNVLLIIVCSLVTFALGVLLGRILGRNQLSEDISQLKADKLVLEEKLSNQKSNFESQLKLVQDAKQSLSQ